MIFHQKNIVTKIWGTSCGGRCVRLASWDALPPEDKKEKGKKMLFIYKENIIINAWMYVYVCMYIYSYVCSFGCMYVRSYRCMHVCMLTIVVARVRGVPYWQLFVATIFYCDNFLLSQLTIKSCSCAGSLNQRSFWWWWKLTMVQ